MLNDGSVTRTKGERRLRNQMSLSEIEFASMNLTATPAKPSKIKLLTLKQTLDQSEKQHHIHFTSQKIITAVAVTTMWFCGYSCAALWCTPGGSNNFWPLWFYLASYTTVLTPGQCYTKLNKGPLMSGYTKSHNSYVAE